MPNHLTFDLAYWINEREAIKTRKEAGLTEPWSPDPNMRMPRYCNVQREDDKVTRWIKLHWRDKNVEDPNFVLSMVLARMVNWPDTLEEIGFPHSWNAKDYAKRIAARAARGEKTWTSAYIVSTCGQPISKENYVCEQVCDNVNRQIYVQSTLIGMHTALMQTPGLGSFLAAQVVADIKNTPGSLLYRAPDWWTWCAPGPGSLRGLSWYFRGRPDAVDVSRFHEEIAKCWLEIRDLIPMRIHMQDFQNCLCEFSKYMRVKHGDRRVRNKYREW